MAYGVDCKMNEVCNQDSVIYFILLVSRRDGREKLQQLWKRQVPMFMASFGNLIRIIKLLSISKKEFQQFINGLKFK